MGALFMSEPAGESIFGLVRRRKRREGRKGEGKVQRGSTITLLSEVGGGGSVFVGILSFTTRDSHYFDLDARTNGVLVAIPHLFHETSQ